jgi:multiple sugar transport system permease protein
MPRTRAPSLPIRVLAHGAVHALALSMILPFLWMIATSLKTDQQALGGANSLLPPGTPTDWAWSNYARAFRAARVGDYYVNSILAAAITTILAGIHNALAGFAFAKLRFAGRRAIFATVLGTMMLPAQVSFIFAYLIAGRLGFVDNLQALVVPFLSSAFGIAYMRGAIDAVPDSLLEAGRIDGMTSFELFWILVRPAIRPASAALAILTFVASWNSFFWPLVVIDSSQRKTLPLAVAELATGIAVQSWPVRMAAATLITLPLIVVFLIFQRAFVRGIALSGIKE